MFDVVVVVVVFIFVLTEVSYSHNANSENSSPNEKRDFAFYSQNNFSTNQIARTETGESCQDFEEIMKKVSDHSNQAFQWNVLRYMTITNKRLFGMLCFDTTILRNTSQLIG